MRMNSINDIIKAYELLEDDLVSRSIVLTLVNDVKKADGFATYESYNYLYDHISTMSTSKNLLLPRKICDWIPIDNTHSQCSCCKAVFKISFQYGDVNYCPNCGNQIQSTLKKKGKTS